MAENYLLGVKKFTSKNGKNCEVMTVRSAFNPRMTAEGCFGESVEELFVPEAMQGKLKVSDIGKKIVIDYEISAGRAYMTGFSVVEPSTIK